jgi:hypothetical protein
MVKTLDIVSRVARKWTKEANEVTGMIQEGDIFYSSWGYDQTNISYYQVVKVGAKTVAIRKVAQKVVREVRGAEYVVPVKGRFEGTAKRKTPKLYRGEPYLNINSYASAYPWNGKPKSQTAAGWGH